MRLVHHQPLRTVVHDMQRSKAAMEISLMALSPVGVAAYLTECLPHAPFPSTLATRLHQRTDGNPLFLVTLLQALAEQGIWHAHDEGYGVQEGCSELAFDVPESLRQVLEQQLRRLSRQA